MSFAPILTAPEFWASIGRGLIITVSLTVLSMILGLALVMAFPQIALWLPQTLGVR